MVARPSPIWTEAQSSSCWSRRCSMRRRCAEDVSVNRVASRCQPRFSAGKRNEGPRESGIGLMCSSRAILGARGECGVRVGRCASRPSSSKFRNRSRPCSRFFSIPLAGLSPTPTSSRRAAQFQREEISDTARFAAYGVHDSFSCKRATSTRRMSMILRDPRAGKI